MRAMQVPGADRHTHIGQCRLPLLFVGCGLLFVVCCLLCVVCCLLFVVCCLLFVVVGVVVVVVVVVVAAWFPIKEMVVG